MRLRWKFLSVGRVMIFAFIFNEITTRRTLLSLRLGSSAKIGNLSKVAQGRLVTITLSQFLCFSIKSAANRIAKDCFSDKSKGERKKSKKHVEEKSRSYRNKCGDWLNGRVRYTMLPKYKSAGSRTFFPKF